MDGTQRRLLLGLALVFVLFIVNFPAGLVLYWITTNLWTIGQQWMIRTTIGPATPVTPVGPPPRKTKKRSGRRRNNQRPASRTPARPRKMSRG